MVFGLVLFVGFALMAVVLLFMLEDQLINRRLRDAAEEVVLLAQKPSLSPRFEIVSADRASPALLERMDGARLGGIREFRLPDQRYVHVLSGEDARGSRYFLAYDVSDQLSVNDALVHGWPWLALAAATLALLAYALATRFVGRISSQASGLVVRIVEADGPGRLRVVARAEPIAEFSELARLSADAWEERLAALDRERETLAFLGHELRTPLQSARTSLALLNEDRNNLVAWQRLQRAQDRLVRATHAVLWLGADRPSTHGESCQMESVMDSLVAEFQPLAASRGQTITSLAATAAVWPMPAEIAETVLANLLLNAMQHGGAGQICLRLDGRGLQIMNPPSGTHDTTGFGLGLELVQRLLERFGWSLERTASSDHVVRVGPANSPD